MEGTPNGMHSCMSRREWLLSVIGWDAGLPLIVSASFSLLPEVVAVILVPIIAALVRAHHGRYQFERLGIAATLSRQVLFGCSIVMLLIFEALSGVLHFDKDAPTSLWLATGGLYLVNLCLVALALRPRRRVAA